MNVFPAMRQPRIRALTLAVLTACFACASGNGPSGTDGDADTNTETDDVLADGDFDADSDSDSNAPSKLGVWVSFEALPDTLQLFVDDRLDDLRARGMHFGRVQIEWGEIEYAPGLFDTSDLEAELTKLDPMSTLVTLITLDSTGYSLPSDLIDASEDSGLIDNRGFDDAVITARFDALLDVVVPVLMSHDILALSIANEPGSRLDEYPADIDALMNFFEHGRAYVHDLAPSIPVSMTMREVEVGYAYLSTVLSSVDIAVFNYYCQNDALEVDVSNVAGEVTTLLEAATGNDIVIQELGCPAAVTGSSESMQAAFFADATAAIAAAPRIKAAFAFQLLDWSDELAAQFEAELVEGGVSEEFAANFAASLRSIGLCSFENEVCRPAYDVFSEAVGPTQ